MSLILDTKTVKIKKNASGKHNVSCIITNYEKFWNHTLNKITYTEKNIKDQTIKLESENYFISLKDFVKKENRFNYNLIARLFIHLKEQLEHLENEKYIPLHINLNDVMYIAENENDYNGIFLLLNTDNFIRYKDDVVTIQNVFNKHSFISPELKGVTELPSIIHFKSYYYNIALLIIYCFNPFKKLESMELFEQKLYFKKYLEEIKDSPIYFALLRCLEEDVNKRYFLYI